MPEPTGPPAKPLFWIASSLRDMRKFPEDVKDALGFALYQAQHGGKSVSAKPLKGFGGAGVLEVVEDHDGATYRAVYTVTFRPAVYVLHAFQKRSRKGIATPKSELDKIKQRLNEALRHHKEWHEDHNTKGGDPPEP